MYVVQAYYNLGFLKCQYRNPKIGGKIMPLSTVGQRIKALRKHYKLNQTAFGKAVGVSYGHISNIESGKDNPSDSLIRLIAIEYCANENWIITGEGEMLEQSFPQDHLSHNESAGLVVNELTKLLESSPASIRAAQISVMCSILQFFKGNSLIGKNKQLSYLEILNDLVHQIARYDSFLQVTCQRVLTKLDEKRIDDTQEDVFCELASLLPCLKDLYTKK